MRIIIKGSRTDPNGEKRSDLMKTGTSPSFEGDGFVNGTFCGGLMGNALHDPAFDWFLS